MSKPEQDANGRFIAGNSGNGGRPKGSRNKLGEEFLRALYADFVAHGVEAIERTREKKPDAYLKVIASILPRLKAVCRKMLHVPAAFGFIDQGDR